MEGGVKWRRRAGSQKGADFCKGVRRSAGLKRLKRWGCIWLGYLGRGKLGALGAPGTFMAGEAREGTFKSG